MIREAIATLVDGKDLSLEEAASVMAEIMDGQASPAQLGAFLTALRIKGETANEIAGLAKVMREKAIFVPTTGPVLDVVGTGGDGLNTFNISTTAAFVAAAAGIKVAKHGNRGATSKCGSADVLEKLGVRIDLKPAEVERCIREVGIGFMFAQNFHPAMKYAAGPRKEIGIRSVFNILGPLTNPARADHQLIGVPSAALAEKIVPALVHLGTRHALVVTGLNGMDELSISGASLHWEILNGKVVSARARVSPSDFGLAMASLDEVRGGNAEENAEMVRDVLKGNKGARRDVVVLNAAAALVAGDAVATLAEGVTLASRLIDTREALRKLNEMVEFAIAGVAR